MSHVFPYDPYVSFTFPCVSAFPHVENHRQKNGKLYTEKLCKAVSSQTSNPGSTEMTHFDGFTDKPYINSPNVGKYTIHGSYGHC